MALAAGCSSKGGAATEAPTVTVTAAPQATAPVASSAPPSEQPTPSAAPPVVSAAPATTQAAPTQPAVRPNRPQRLVLGAGETAHLTYFDVTLQRSTAGEDLVSRGWRVQVCYTHPHAGQNADGTTRVSKDPWSISVLDGEGGGSLGWIAIKEFPADPSWSPLFRETQLRLGQCQTGWIAIRHDDPDLLFDAIRYQPANFGDTVIWYT